MATTTLEERVTELESQVAELLKLVHERPAKDAWRKVVGMFANDPEIDDLHKETQRIRDEDRTATRNPAPMMTQPRPT